MILLYRSGLSDQPSLTAARREAGSFLALVRMQSELSGADNCQILTGDIISGYARTSPDAAVEPCAVRLRCGGAQWQFHGRGRGAERESAGGEPDAAAIRAASRCPAVRSHRGPGGPDGRRRTAVP